LGRTQVPKTSTQAETATNNGNGSVTTVNWGATRLSIISFKALIPSFRTDLGGTAQ
jgi:hypothetical protein